MDPTRKRGKKNTSKSQMDKYLRTFGTDEQIKRLEDGDLTGSEVHSINRRNAAHYGTLLKHLDKKSGGLEHGRALRMSLMASAAGMRSFHTR